MILGGDYSLYDQILDWKNHSWYFGFIKISEGTYEDPVFAKQWSAAKGQIYRGAYHFFRPNVSWKLAAEKVVSLLDREGLGELPCVLDLEASNNISKELVREYGLEWLRYIHRETGQRPIVYTGPGFANSIELYKSVEYSDYLLWQATYPWDTILSDWTEEQRDRRLHEVISGTYQYKFPIAARPWLDTGRPVTFSQFTGKCPPEYVPGYPLGFKKAVDVNFYRGTLQDLIFQFNLPQLQKGDIPVNELPITWTTTLKDGMKANIRNGPSLSNGIIETLTGLLELKGTGQKVQKDNYYWGELVYPKRGWVAFTTSMDTVVWTDPPVQTTRKAIKSVTFYDDGSVDEFFPKQL